MDDAHRGDLAFEASEWNKAIEHYGAAIQKSPAAVNYYVKRSTAWLRSGKPDESLLDAEKAVVLATERGKRELIAQAQLRRAIALFQKGAFGDCQFLLGISEKRNPSEKTLGVWKAKVQQELKKLPEGDDKGKVHVEEVPKIDKAEITNGSNKSSADSAQPMTSTTAPTIAKQKIRHDWYQSAEKVYVSILVKGAQKDQVSVDILPNSVSAQVSLGEDHEYHLTLDPLFAPIKADASEFKVMSTKVEITLIKSSSGQQWGSLEGAGDSAMPISGSSQPTNTASTSAPAEASNTGPSYPTSSRNGPKNWDKIASSYVRPTGKEKKEGDQQDEFIDDEFDEGDPVNGFFKKLYAGASDETKRAMMKSYQESGGTALSTNWSEVGKERVKVSPPDGMEEKKWEQ